MGIVINTNQSLSTTFEVNESSGISMKWHNAFVTVNSEADVVFTLNKTLAPGFSGLLYQKGSGKIKIESDDDITVLSKGGKIETDGVGDYFIIYGLAPLTFVLDFPGAGGETPGIMQNLEQVTTVGNETTKEIIVRNQDRRGVVLTMKGFFGENPDADTEGDEGSIRIHDKDDFIHRIKAATGSGKNITHTLPNTEGVFAKYFLVNEFDHTGTPVADETGLVILTRKPFVMSPEHGGYFGVVSPNGGIFKLTVSDDGILSTEPI